MPLEQAVAAYDLYQQATPYPSYYAEQVREARTALEELGASELTVEVKCTNGGILLRTEASRA